MSDVAAGHKVTIIAHRRNAILFFGGAIDRDRFAENVAITDDDLSGCAFVGQVLWFGTNDDVREQMVIATDTGIAVDRYIVFQTSPSADLHAGTNHAVVTNADFVIQLGSGSTTAVCAMIVDIDAAFQSRSNGALSDPSLKV